MRWLIRKTMDGLARVFWVAAGISFWVGGRALHEFAGVERFKAEAWGIWAAVGMALIAGVISWFGSESGGPRPTAQG